jgi:hypothetical protein
LLGLFFDPEDGGDMFLRNKDWLSTTKRRYIPEDGTLHNHRCENLKSYKLIVALIIKKFPAFYGTQKFIAVFTIARLNPNFT